jgi:hypothetical protein
MRLQTHFTHSNESSFAMTQSKLLLLTAALVCTLVLSAEAQNRGGRPRGGTNGNNNNNNNGGRGNFNPQDYRQRMDDRMKEDLAASDEEWKKLQPKIERVRSLQRDALRESMGAQWGNWGNRGRGASGGAGAPGDAPKADAATNPASQPAEDAAPTTIEQARQALRTALADTNTAPDQITKLLQTFREARDKSRKELTDAQADLKAAVTPWQEAHLVAMGLLE